MSLPIEETAARFWGAVWDWARAIDEDRGDANLTRRFRVAMRAFERHEDALISETLGTGRDPRPKKRRKKK